MISRAAQALQRLPAIHVAQLSFLKEYDPIGGPPQNRYVNAVVEVETTLSPRDLLRVLQDIERALGRQPSSVHWGPRPIDLDILLYAQLMLDEPDLTIPHPRMHERKFVLDPLAQLAPQIMHPVLHKTAQELLEALCASSAPSAR